MKRWLTHDRGGAPGQLRQCTRNPKRWQLRVSRGYDPITRKRRRDVTETFYGTKKQAEARLNALLQQKYENRLQERTDITVSELAEEWLASKINITDRTRAGYRNSLEVYVLPTLGKMKVRDVTWSIIQELYNAMTAGNLPTPRDAQRGWRGGKLSPATVRQAHAALNQALIHAVKSDYIHRNPAELVELPQRRADATNPRALSTAELVRFIEACGTSYYGILYRVLAETGVRPGEACALTWADVNLEDGTITVDKAVTKGEAGERVVSTTKTRNKRQVFAPPALLEALRQHHDQQQSLNLDASGHMFVTPDGQPLAPWRLNRRDLPRVLRAAGIKPDGVSFYSLRHTFATSLLTSAVPDKVASRLMGHADVKMTHHYQQTTADAELHRQAALQRAAHLEAEAKKLRQEASMRN